MMSKYYNISNLFDENGEPVKVTLKIKRKNNQIDYKTAYKATYDAFNNLYRRYNDLDKRINKANEYIEKHLYKRYDLNGEEYTEPREFEKNTDASILLKILKGEIE